ncbi:MAG: hypothetical protein AAF928_04890 [Myxococcota bacterium]
MAFIDVLRPLGMRWGWFLNLAVLGCGASDAASDHAREAAPEAVPTKGGRATLGSSTLGSATVGSATVGSSTLASASGSAPDPEDPKSRAEASPVSPYGPGVPAYLSARELCTQHVNGQQMHIVWTGYATVDAIGTVRAFYEAHTAAAGGTFEPEGEGFRVVGTDGLRLTAHVVGAGHPTCDVAPADTDRTYLVLSRATR